jgi:hypothetical protein
MWWWPPQATAMQLAMHTPTWNLPDSCGKLLVGGELSWQVLLIPSVQVLFFVYTYLSISDSDLECDISRLASFPYSL